MQRNDGLNEKVLLVNDVLKKICESVDIEYINNVNIRPDVHLNRSNLHLNKKGNNILTSNIRSFFNKIILICLLRRFCEFLRFCKQHL